MTASRRAFLAALGSASAVTAAEASGLLSPRPLHAADWLAWRGREGRADDRPMPAELILLNSNENPYGPASDALDAVMQMFGQAARYPDTPEDELRAAIAAHHGIPVESVILGCGSTEVLAFITQALTSPSRGLLTVAPTFETPRDVAARQGVPVREVEVDGSLRVDLQAMYELCRGAGLLFICNPNNPTGTLHGIGDLLHFVRQVHARDPEATVLVDEAYFEYVDDPAYGSAIPAAVEDRRLLVSRTFSKVYGMAGIRAGYAVGHPDTIRRLQAWRTPSGISVFAAAAARASLDQRDHVERQRTLNRDARRVAMDAMRSLGLTVVPSQTNFFLTDIRRDPQAFREAARARGVAVGRPFPPLKTHMRLSIGTMDEMQRALPVLSEILRSR
jgi:histidinol-phosphate aminotransferase